MQKYGEQNLETAITPTVADFMWKPFHMCLYFSTTEHVLQVLNHMK